MVLTAGKLNVEDLLGGDPAGKLITKIGVGTSNTPADPADTALTGAVIKPVTTVNYLANNIVEFQATLADSDPAMTIEEMGLYNDDDVLVHRKVIPSKVKVLGVSYSLSYKVKIV
jgi:hypothetical protein